MARIDSLLKYLKEQHGSDLHLGALLEPRIRISGAVVPVDGWPAMPDDELRPLLHEILSQAQWDEFQANLEVHFAYTLDGVARFRVSYFNQENGVSAAFRIFPESIPTFDELGLPLGVQKLAHLHGGLLLVSGVPGSGISTTIAALVDTINTAYEKHIVTIEEPIEYVHTGKRAVVSQREVGTHAKSFDTALALALRQNPDVIVVSHLRGRETVELVARAAEMGILVIAAMSARSTSKVVEQLFEAFPADEQAQIRIGLSECLVGIVSQILLRSADGKGMCPANEILTWSPDLPGALRDGDAGRLPGIISGGREYGMRSMDDALLALVQQRRILLRDAYLRATDRSRFETAGA